MTIAGRSVKCVSGTTARWRTEDDLPSEIPSSDVVLRDLKGVLRQNQQDPGPNSGSDDPSDSA